MNKLTALLVAALALGTMQSALADASLDSRMMQLATSAGCTMCHSMKSVKPGPNGMAPIAPSWQDISQQYRGQAKARETLLSVVMGGSSVYGSHWEDKVSGTVMPPNAIPITEEDARKLIAWILGLRK